MLKSTGRGEGEFLEAKEHISYFGLRIHYHWLGKWIEKVQIKNYHELVMFTG